MNQCAVENPTHLQRKVKALKKLHLDHRKLEVKYFTEWFELHLKYGKLYAPLYEKRREIVSGSIEIADCDFILDDEDEDKDTEQGKSLDIKIEMDDLEVKEEDFNVKGIPNFWLTALKREPDIAELIKDADEPILQHLSDIKARTLYEYITTTCWALGFCLEFYFTPNPFFSNLVLSKNYERKCTADPNNPYMFVEPDIIKSKGCIIDWKKGVDVTMKTTNKKQNDSFFNFFSPPEVEEDETNMDEETSDIIVKDFLIGEVIKYYLIPEAVLFYTGEILIYKNNLEFIISKICNTKLVRMLRPVLVNWTTTVMGLIHYGSTTIRNFVTNKNRGAALADMADIVKVPANMLDKAIEAPVIIASSSTDTKYPEALKTQIQNMNQCAVEIPTHLQQKVKALKKLHLDHVNLEVKYFTEMDDLELKYEKLYAPLYEKRREIVSGSIEIADCDFILDDEDEDKDTEQGKSSDIKIEMDDLEVREEDFDDKGIPNFWLTALKAVPKISKMIKDDDEPILQHLRDIKTRTLTEPLGCCLEFYFTPNPFFSNPMLSKYYMKMKCADEPNDIFAYYDPRIIKCKGCVIDWKKGVDFTVKTVKKKQNDSFFKFFSPPEAEEDEAYMDEETLNILKLDFHIGHVIKGFIIPASVIFYTGENLMYEKKDEKDEKLDKENEDGERDGHSVKFGQFSKCNIQ